MLQQTFMNSGQEFMNSSHEHINAFTNFLAAFTEGVRKYVLRRDGQAPVPDALRGAGRGQGENGHPDEVSAAAVASFLLLAAAVGALCGFAFTCCLRQGSDLKRASTSSDGSTEDRMQPVPSGRRRGTQWVPKDVLADLESGLGTSAQDQEAPPRERADTDASAAFTSATRSSYRFDALSAQAGQSREQPLDHESGLDPQHPQLCPDRGEEAETRVRADTFMSTFTADDGAAAPRSALAGHRSGGRRNPEGGHEEHRAHFLPETGEEAPSRPRPRLPSAGVAREGGAAAQSDAAGPRSVLVGRSTGASTPASRGRLDSVRSVTFAGISSADDLTESEAGHAERLTSEGG